MAAINTIIAACAHLHPQRTLALLRDYEKEAAAGARWYVEDGGWRMEDGG